MIKILHSADWHINLHKKKVPYEWQANRFRLFFEEIHKLESDCDVHILAGDVFDRKPEPDEVCLFLRFANSVTIPTYIIPGNHEATRKGKTFLEYFHEQHAITNPNVVLITENKSENIQGQDFCFFPYGEMQTDNLPEYKEGEILVTHIRGEVPPHITPEYDFEKLRPWPLILLGDIHFNHRYLDYPAYYCGSPMNVTFDRDNTKNYGVNIIEYTDKTNYSIDFKIFNLPKLIRKTVNVTDELKEEDYHHTIYEVTGNLDELSKVKDSKLLDKKIAYKPDEDSKLDLKDKNIIEELDMYLEHIKVNNPKQIINEFLELNINV